MDSEVGSAATGIIIINLNFEMRVFYFIFLHGGGGWGFGGLNTFSIFFFYITFFQSYKAFHSTFFFYQ